MTTIIIKRKETMIDKAGMSFVDFLARVGTAIVNHPVRFGLIMGGLNVLDTIALEIGLFGVVISSGGAILYGAGISFGTYYLLAKFAGWLSRR